METCFLEADPQQCGQLVVALFDVWGGHDYSSDFNLTSCECRISSTIQLAPEFM